MAPKETPFVLSLLSRAHSPDTAIKIYTERILQRPLHLAPNNNSLTPQQTRRLKRIRKQFSRVKKPGKPRPLSSRQVRSLDLYHVPKSAQKYDIFSPLHKLWTSYIQEILWDSKGFNLIKNTQAAKLCSADFHGAELQVVRSRCVSRVGVKGIVVKDSKSVFELITKEDQIKIIPKEGTVFRFEVSLPKIIHSYETEVKNEILPGNCFPQPDAKISMHKKESAVENSVIFELHGDQFRYRATDRSNRKFKSHFLPNL